MQTWQGQIANRLKDLADIKFSRGIDAIRADSFASTLRRLESIYKQMNM